MLEPNGSTAKKRGRYCTSTSEVDCCSCTLLLNRQRPSSRSTAKVLQSSSVLREIFFPLHVGHHVPRALRHDAAAPVTPSAIAFLPITWSKRASHRWPIWHSHFSLDFIFGGFFGRDTSLLYDDVPLLSLHLKQVRVRLASFSSPLPVRARRTAAPRRAHRKLLLLLLLLLLYMCACARACA